MQTDDYRAFAHRCARTRAGKVVDSVCEIADMTNTPREELLGCLIKELQRQLEIWRMAEEERGDAGV